MWRNQCQTIITSGKIMSSEKRKGNKEDKKPKKDPEQKHKEKKDPKRYDGI
jgi:hypothetical protein